MNYKALENKNHLKRIRIIADYQFGKNAGKSLFPDNVTFQFSSTKKVRQILLNNERIATVRANDGMLTLGIKGGKLLHSFIKYPSQRVVVNKDAAPFVAKGKTAFAKHVVSVDSEIRSNQEILVVDEDDNLLATGKSLLCADEMSSFKKGIAVDTRGFEKE